MEKQLIEENLWSPAEGPSPAQSIVGAWRVLARLGAPGRFVGRTQDGQYEYLIVDAESGLMLASGKGESVSAAICAAALASRRRSRLPKKTGRLRS
jgi:hypothetical protein